MKKKALVFKSRKEAETFYDPARDGVTFGLLERFMACRERARLFLEGWSGEAPVFALVYGTVAHHLLHQAYDQFIQGKLTETPSRAWVVRVLTDVERRWYQDNPHPSQKAEQIFQEVLMKNQAVMPEYFRYWSSDFDPARRTWLEVENTFNLPWTVTTRQGVQLNTFLRGRIDAAYRIPHLKNAKRRAAPRLFETKTRTDIDEALLIDAMPHERQLTTYLSVLRQKTGLDPAGALLNIIRKPQLRQRQKEDWAQFAKRIERDVQTRPEWYFVRMEMTISPQEINRAEAEMDDLISDFLLWRAGESGHYKNSRACVEYKRPCDYIRVCSHGDYRGLVKRPVVFRELEEE